MQNTLPAGPLGVGASLTDKLDEGHGRIGPLRSASVHASVFYSFLSFVIMSDRTNPAKLPEINNYDGR